MTHILSVRLRWVALFLVSSIALTSYAGSPAPTAATPVPALSEAEVRATIAHMGQLAQDQQSQLIGQEKLLAADAATIKSQAADLTAARSANAMIARTAADLTVQVRKQDQAIAAERWGKWKAEIFGWPIALIAGAVIGMFLMPVLKLGFSAGLKAVTGL